MTLCFVVTSGEPKAAFDVYMLLQVVREMHESIKRITTKK